MAKQRRVFIAIAILAGIGSACYFLGAFRSKPTINMLFVTLDTTRADRLGCYRYQSALTPALDALAAEGVLFERAYSPAPLTLPSHATMFTGLYPPEHGLRTNGRGRLDASIPVLPELAAKRGYDTGAFVASFVVDSKFGLDRGFKVYNDDLSTAEVADEAIHRQRDGKLVVDAAVEWLKQPREMPFFCWVHLYDPHFPYIDHQAEFGDRFIKEPYDAEIAYTDKQIARLLEHLKAAGLNEQTIVVVVGDHGEGLSEHTERTHGYTLYESTQRVPLIVRAPGKVAAGHRVKQPIPLVDLAPTMIELLGLSNPGPMSGQSFSQLLSGKPATERVCFSATDDPFLQNGWCPLQSVVSGNWKYIRTTKPELYDLAADPGETKNLADSDAARLAQLEQTLDELQRKLVQRKTEDVQLSADERRALESLGYLGGGRATTGRTGDSVLPDVKDMLPFDVAAQDAQELLRAGQIEPAIKQLQEIVAQSPTHLAARIFLGEAMQHQHQLKQAIAAYQEALRIKPDYPDALIHLGNAYVEQRRFDDAIKQFDEAVRIDPESSTAHYNLGLALAHQGQTNDAILEYREAIRHDEGFADVNTALGNALISLQQTEEAIKCFKQELKVNRHAVDARINLAVLLRESDPKAARTWLLEAVKIDPKNAQAQYNLGAFLLLHGEADAAIAPLSEALRLMPKHPRAASELEKARNLAGKQRSTTN